MIKGLSNVRQIPRLGKIRTGIKVPNKSGSGEHPEAVQWFVLPEEIAGLFGEKPTSLPIMFPVEDETKFASQFYKCYSSFRGLTCKGDGETCSRLIDIKTGDFAHRDTTETDRRELLCNGRDCPMYQQKKCKEVMNLMFLLPSVPGLGVWQLDTGSYHSIVAVNSAIDLIRGMCGRINMIPLKLTIEPREVTVKTDKGQVKKTVSILQIRTDVTLAEIQKLGALPGSQVLLPAPDEDKPELLYPNGEEEQTEADKDFEALGKERDKPIDSVDKTPSQKQEAKPEKAVKGKVKTEDKPVEVTDPAPAEPKTLNNLGEFFTACNKRWGITPSEVEKLLGKARSQLFDLTAEWAAIKKVQEGK
jgi:hypothetical protein